MLSSSSSSSTSSLTPHRPRATCRSDFNHKRRTAKSAAVSSLAHGARITRKHDMLEGAAAGDESSSSSSASASDEHEEPAAGVMFSFDAARAPTQGSQILNVALARAVERFEERETAQLVKDEYAVLDTQGEVVLAPTKARKGKGGKTASSPVVVPDADEDYEFV